MKRALLFGGVPVIAGIVLIAMWVVADKTASRGNDWTQVLGTIESATVRAGAVDIAYRYEFAGSQHRNPSGRLTLRGNAASSAAARYAPGRTILAYANPAAPAESILEPNPRPSPINLIAGSVLAIMGLPIAIFFLRQKPSKRKPVRKPSRPMSRLKPPPPVPRK